MSDIAKKEKEVFKVLKDKLSLRNIMESPRFSKVVLSTGTGSIDDKNKIEVIQDRLKKITGQKAAPRVAKKSIATFKLREGSIIGYMVTLRGKRMYDFLDRFFTVALPRTRDFRGIETSSVDGMGNITIGIKEHTIFPETSDEELKDIFGIAVTIVTTAKTREAAIEFLGSLGTPFKK
jgi:large subunit ribosomal protein L5